MASLPADGDPLELFTPQKPASRHARGQTQDIDSGSEEVQVIDAPSRRVPGTKHVFSHISPPRLDEASKARYVPLTVPDSEEEDGNVVDLVGEAEEDGVHYIFALYDDDIIRRKQAEDFEESHPRLFNEFERKKEIGELAKFDPSSTQVHPKDRIYQKIKISKKKHEEFQQKHDRKRRRASSSNSERYGGSGDEGDDDNEEGDDEDEYGGRSQRKQHSRAAKNHSLVQSQLPFSPKKTRSRGRVQTQELTDDEFDGENQPQLRRGTRTRSGKKQMVDDDEEFDELMEEDDSDLDEDEGKGKKASKGKKRHAKALKPEYGRIHDIKDEGDSDEDAPLRAHRELCEKCDKEPSHLLLKKAKRRKGRKKRDDDFEETEEERALRLGGWVRCLKCCVANHWRCIPKTQQDDIMKAARAKDAEGAMDTDLPKRSSLGINEATEFICNLCSKGAVCMMCEETVLEPEVKGTVVEGEEMQVDPQGADNDTREVLFRCLKCKRVAHYEHLPAEANMAVHEVASFYQANNEWQCAECASFTFRVDKVLAWRPSPKDAIDPYKDKEEPPNYKEALQREYLVKWELRSYRRVQWVPHMWLLSTQPQLLRQFLTKGSRVELLPEARKGEASSEDITKPSEVSEMPIFGEGEESREASTGPAKESEIFQPPPLVDAEDRIPLKWLTIDRALDVRIWSPRKNKPQRAKTTKRNRKGARQISDDESDELDDLSPEAEDEWQRAFDDGDQPSEDYIETVEEYESRTGNDISVKDIDKVVWVFTKWSDLTYDESSWDSPPKRGSPFFKAFENAFDRFVTSRSVTVPKLSVSQIEELEKRKSKGWKSEKLGIPENGEYDIGQNSQSKLMDFQVNGVNWLCRNWYRGQQCILADEMGLGKTVQIVTFIGLLHDFGVYPSLVVVPHSTITNWVREFEKWAPHLRVVPFYGESTARSVIKTYELFHEEVAPGTTGAKFHVLVTTYETAIAAKEMTAVFKRIPRWEVLVVDEGQRLKGDSSLLFKCLTDLKTCYRVLMTGTPLNNNIRELFNLMHFLDPKQWNDLKELENRFAELDDERIKELHEMLRPYFLRRVKGDVLKLPPKNEVIVPVSMAPLQKEVYKSLLSKNLAVLTSLAGNNSRVSSSKKNNLRTNMNNLLMQLRKCLQHPYLVSEDMEPKGLSLQEAHLKLIDASAKLRLLKTLLPQLKARGHRVLLFSQFKLVLNIVEDFLAGEGYKFLRLDGDTKQHQRQKDMDAFNQEGSDIFVYILTTRAGGVGINLWSADTVIIFDPDFNPHQDLQAIARAHRYGQTKTCLVFKLMVKDSAEEKIVQAGKKKLVLDHLIVQTMDTEDDANDVQSILTFGANALFNENEESRAITYNEQDIEKLIEKTEKEGDEQAAQESSSNAFTFAKIWSLHKDDIEELVEEDNGDQDSWAQTLAKMMEDQKKIAKEEKTGRGARRKAALATKNYFEDGASPSKVDTTAKGKARSVGSEDEYNGKVASPESSGDSDSDTEETEFEPPVELNGQPVVFHVPGDSANLQDPGVLVKKKRKRSRVAAECGLCGSKHGPQQCFMTQSVEHLAEYRLMLVNNVDEEDYETRHRAIRVIDRALKKRKSLKLIEGQPTHPLRGQAAAPMAPKYASMIASSTPVTAPFPMAKNITKNRADHPFRKVFPPSQASTSTTTTSLKRSSSPLPQAANVKKPRLSSGGVAKCPLCKGDPHDLRDCRVVRLGPASIAKAIKNLSMEDGRHNDTLKALRPLYLAARTAQIASSSSLPPINGA